MEKLVSILTPCFNGEKFIDSYVQSLLAQDYHNCQLIFMDDGSTDKTKEKILEYKSTLENNGIILEYHYHDNIGLGGTIAEGIKYVNGDYLIWPDIDDQLLPNSIKLKADFLNKNKTYGVVRSNFVRSLNDLENIYDFNGTSKYKHKKKKWLFNDYLVSKNMWLQPGCYMIRVSALDDANPKRYIYPTRTGQDWQMLLPVLYKFKCGYVDKTLFNYLVRSDSLSNSAKKNYDMRSKQLDKYEELIKCTICHMDVGKKEKSFLYKVHHHYLKQHFLLCFEYSDIKNGKYYFDQMPFFKKGLKIKVKYFLMKHPKFRNTILRITRRRK